MKSPGGRGPSAHGLDPWGPIRRWCWRCGCMRPWIGSARAIDRLCQQHAAYRWLCGGAPINHDLLAAFRRENAAALDRLLTQSLTGLIAETLITLEELTIKPAPAQAGGTKVRARAGGAR